MNVVHTLSELRAYIKEARQQGQSIGFVPTMGNLHAGHISLIDQSRQQGCFTVASIFVNPLQFNDPDDLARYPRTLDADAEKLQAADCQLLFAPDVDEMYPEGQDNQSRVSVPGVSEGLCGGSRPGHFDGVATVVTKLFNMVQPDMAFFGQKDYQQVAVIRKMVADLNMPVDVVSVPTARAADGLALSSRNGYLTSEERARAPALNRALRAIFSSLQTSRNLELALAQGDAILADAGLETDYLEVRHADNLQPVLQKTLEQRDQNTGKPLEIVIPGAAFLGKARLIDNIVVDLNPHND
ncbi:MAG: pantoate--beta-alanine ligase [Oceanospirillaceae bacterium]|nr:pantoate--beta-alanine ligase [Oceanospirillaceae bacterium]